MMKNNPLEALKTTLANCGYNVAKTYSPGKYSLPKENINELQQAIPQLELIMAFVEAEFEHDKNNPSVDFRKWSKSLDRLKVARQKLKEGME